METQDVFLEKVRIQNFLSLRNVELPLRQLTILVGPNASGKSNVLHSLSLLNSLMEADLPNDEFIADAIWAGQADKISFELYTHVGDSDTVYKLNLQPVSNNEVSLEELKVDNKIIISVINGQGEVVDEQNNGNVTIYNPSIPKIALISAGDYGGKPITKALSQFISDWEFYNFEPLRMRGGRHFIFIVNQMGSTRNKKPAITSIDDDGSMLYAVLANWAENHEQLFEVVSDSLKKSTNLKIEKQVQGDDVELYLQEGYKNPIPLKRASDGTLRLIAYYILLNQPELPSLIAIEEPERNLHPGALLDMASVLEQLAEKTQVIITTHSSQLLDSFNADNLSDTLGVLLLQNIPGQGTEVINLEEVKKDRAALDGWIADFGIGSAIFDSELLQDLVGV